MFSIWIKTIYTFLAEMADKSTINSKMGDFKHILKSVKMKKL
jgi:hypothetical protein